jgi:hypothetical protein
MPPHAAPSVRTIRKPPCQRSHCPHSSRPDMSWNSRPMNPPSISSPRWPGAHSMPVSPAHPIGRRYSQLPTLRDCERSRKRILESRPSSVNDGDSLTRTEYHRGGRCRSAAVGQQRDSPDSPTSGHPTGHRAGSRRPPSRRQGARDARTRAVDAAGSRFLQKRPRVWTSGDLDHLLPWSGRRPQILGTSRSHGRPCAGCRK